jgi:hypothetical protein
VGREDEELEGDQPLSPELGGVGEQAVAGEAPHDDPRGKPSIAESMPKPISATDPAISPARMAMPPSTDM